MTRYVNSIVLRCRRSRFMKSKALSIFVLLACGSLLLTGCASSAVPKGWSGPVAVDGSVYVGSMTGKVIAYDGATGVEKGSYPDEGSILTTNPYFYSAPVVDGITVYIGCYNGKVYVLNASNSLRKLWNYPSGDTLLGPIVGSPAVDNGYLYFGSSDKYLYAVDTATKQLKWKFETGGKIWSTPVVYNGTVFVGSFDKKLYALDALTGDKKWEFKAGGAIASSPIVYNDTIYFGSLDRKFYALDAATGQPKSGFATFEADDWFWSKAVAYNGSIIVCSLDGWAHAIDASTGAEIWKLKPGGSIRGNPALVNNLIVVGTDEGGDRGNVYCITADTGQLVWEYPPDEETMYAVRASICAGNNTVYVHTINQRIFAIEASSGNVLWDVSTGGGE